METYKSTGTLKYDPNSKRGTFLPWYVILQCDRELVRYYQHIFYRLYWKKLQTAMWGPHITIVRGTKPKAMDAWKQFDGRALEFSYTYDGGFYTNGHHYWINAKSLDFYKIRESLGLPREPECRFHLSIGSVAQ